MALSIAYLPDENNLILSILVDNITTSKIHLAVDAHGMPVRFFITSGTTADCTVAAQLIGGFQAEYLLADRGYDTAAIIRKAVNEGMIPVIPPRKNRKHLREYDEYLYKLHHLVENAFLLLKKWRGIATRCAKNASSFAAAVQIRCIAIWLLVYWPHCLVLHPVRMRT